ncbi:copper homeostasis periplasmic binding protein CopC [Polaromonas jejuensis]|uniref:Copper homeostasis periplasmic binding protein CopC n=1 Tax=Polaromonas jejuensis TaxID=457502 RepID=A0ABW0QD32_9BURK|nr:copper homeostasis periplasmic binding protein CopC [Polaromonas jejuensis]
MPNSSFHCSAIRAFFRLSAVVSALCLGSIGQAWAHAHPETQSPVAGSVVSAPQEVRITYNEALEPAFSSLVVIDARGKQVNSAKAEVDATTHKTMRLALPTLPAGAYQVKWVAVADDGHRTKGSYKFTVK